MPSNEFEKRIIPIALVIIAVAAVVVAYSAYQFFVVDQQKSVSNSPVNLTVNILSTSDGMTGDGMYADKYPKTVQVSNAGAFADQIAAYGAAYNVWIAPKDWTGSGGSGVDGNAGADLYPINNSSSSGPHISFVEIPACVGCMLGEAAPYFTSAMQEYNQTYNKDGSNPITVPQGLQIVSLSPTLITYTLPDIDGLMVRGVVYYNNDFNSAADQSHVPFAEAKFILPHEDAGLSDFLAQTFISREDLK